VSALVAGTVWLMRPAPPPPQHEAVTVLISDFVNRTGDPVFDGSLEQPLGIGIEGASFVTSFPRRDALRTARRIKPDATGIDEAMARLISQREAIKVVLAGSIERAGSGYDVSVRMLDPVPGTELARLDAKAAGKAEVLQAVGTLAARTREALGDTVTESERAAAEAFTAASLEAARDYEPGPPTRTRTRKRSRYKRASRRIPTRGAFPGGAASAIARAQGRGGPATRARRLGPMTERESADARRLLPPRRRQLREAIENFEALVQKPRRGPQRPRHAISAFNFTKALRRPARYAITPAARSTGPTSPYAIARDFATARSEAKMARPGISLLRWPWRARRQQVPDAIKAWEQARGRRGESLASSDSGDIALSQWRATARWHSQPGLADLAEKNQMGGAACQVACRGPVGSSAPKRRRSTRSRAMAR
jgi:hypothetical protein